MGCNQVFDRIFNYPYFFTNPVRFQHQVPDQPVSPDRVLKLYQEHHSWVGARAWILGFHYYKPIT
jgi:hypothetical protein